MRKVLLSMLAFYLVAGFGNNTCQAEVSIGATVGKEGLESFYLAIGEHYTAPEKEIIFVRERNISDEELPVVFYLAQRSGIAPSVILRLRLGGKSWMEITTRCGLTAEAFYVPVTSNPGPPYGKAYGHFKKHRGKNWSAIQLTDVDIVNFVNLKFISEYYGYSPDAVIKMREKGTDFVSINAEVKKNKGQSKNKSEKMASTKEFEEDNKGKGCTKKKK